MERTLKRSALNVLGLTLGLLAGYLVTGGVTAYAQSKNIVVSKGFTLCQDVTVPTLAEAQALPVTLKVDNITMTVTPTWTATPGSTTQFRVNIPITQLPAAQVTNGRHDFILSVGGFLLADGTFTQPTVTTDWYVMVPDTGPQVGPIKWIRSALTVIAQMFGAGPPGQQKDPPGKGKGK
jgi:hypothetical protein